MIRLEQVTKSYGEQRAVNGLSLEINTGEVCVLIGLSGCGKTTTLRMINRLIEPSAGRIFIDEQDVGSIKAEELRLSIGYAIQSVGLFPHLSVSDNIAVVPQILRWEKGRIATRVEELLDLVGLNPAEYAEKYPRQLSGGEAQRIGVARALAADPPIMLMDEPFGAVDPLTRERLQTLFLHIQQEVHKTIILVTHDLDEAIRLADRIAIMDSGRILQYDTPGTILSKPMNTFVRDFVGADRALKRLACITVKDYVKPTPAVNIDSPLQEALSIARSHRRLWVVDDRKRLLGWVEKDGLAQTASIRGAMQEGDAEEIALLESDTLRVALAQILGQGFKHIPVVDGNKRLIGELSLRDVEAATTVMKA